ncbi:MAG: hypothetical protein ACI3VS_07735 [Evtepia sp.]
MTMTKDKKHRILISFCLLVSLPVLLAGCTYDSPPATGTICGSYTSDEGVYQKIFSVDQSNVFYYADQKNDDYILGRIQPQGEDSYLLSCQDSNNADIIPDQEFAYDGKGFSITIQDQPFSFQKVDDEPCIIGDIARYS